MSFGTIANMRRRWDDAQRALKSFLDPEAELSVRLRRQLRHKRLVVCLSHGDHHLYLGGVQLYMRVEQRSLDAREVSYVNLWPLENDAVAVSCDGAVLGEFERSQIMTALSGLTANGFRIAATIIHHLKGWRLDFIDSLLDTIAAPVTRFFIHDYHSICVNPNLTFGDVTFCRAPPPESQACTICHYGVARRAQLPAMKRLMEQLANRETQFIAPSQAAADVWIKDYPTHRARVRVLPHQALVATGKLAPARHRKPRLGLVGYGTRSKGSSEWMALIATPELRRQFQLYHFGECNVGCDVQHVNASFIKDGYDAMLKTLRKYQLDFAFLWSIWPETFSFTCFEAIAAGSFILTNENSGNIAAQVRRTGRGRVFADVAEARAFLLDAPAVAAARAGRAGHDALSPMWTDTLTSELA